MKKDIHKPEEIQESKIDGCLMSSDENKNHCMTCPLKSHSLMHDLSLLELEALDKERYTQVFKAGEPIYKEGSKPKGLICLKSGKIKITKSVDAKTEIIIDLKKPVDFLSVKSLMMGEFYTDSAIALEDSSVCVIDKVSFFEVVSKNPIFSMRLIQFFAKKLDESENRILNLTNKHMRARLAEALLLVYDIFGATEDDILNVKLKRAELAALANMIPSNAIRILSGFVKENLIETKRREIKILHMDGLKEVSKFGFILK